MTFTDNDDNDRCQGDTYPFCTEKTRSVYYWQESGPKQHCDIPVNLSVCLLSKIARDLHSMR